MRPRDCFAERVPFFEPHKVFAGGEQVVQAGLDALGRRERPETSDFFAFLQILMGYKDGAACDARECEQALHALSSISGSFDAAENGDLPVLTVAGQLVPFCDAFEDDAPHLKGRIETADLKIIDPRIPARIRYAAARLAEAVVENLDETPTPSLNREIESACHRIAAILRSLEFAHGLRRIVSHRHRVDASVPDLGRFHVCPAAAINTTLCLKIADGAQRRLGSGEVSIFIDKNDLKIWVATTSRRKIAIELAKAIDGLLGEFKGVELAALEDMLRVTRKEEIQEVLNDRRVPALKKSEQTVFAWDGLDPEAGGWDDAEGDYTVPDDDHDTADIPVPASADDGPGGSAEPYEATQMTNAAQGHVDFGGDLGDPTHHHVGSVLRSANGEDTTNTSGAAAGSQPTSPQPLPSGSNPRSVVGPRSTRPASDDAPPIAPGHGSADVVGPTDGNGADGDPVHNVPSTSATGTTNRGRFVTYVSSAVELNLGPRVGDGSEHALAIGRLAVERVLTFERLQGRTPQEMPHSNPGHDVISTDSAGIARYIEVKGIDGPWGEAGVTLSKRQFEFATAKGDETWLYVVEQVSDDNGFEIFTINDPARKVTHFCFDAGWQAANHRDTVISGIANGPPLPGDHVVLLDGDVVEVTEVAKHGIIVQLTVLSAGGESRQVVWRPGMRIEGQGA